jgi:hypothetical protein
MGIRQRRATELEGLRGLRGRTLLSLVFAAALACQGAALVQAQDQNQDEVGAPLAPESGPAEPAILAPAALGTVNVLLAGHRTAAARYTDTHSKRRRPIIRLVRARIQDDKNFTNRTRFLAHRIGELARPVGPTELGIATTGDELLDALVQASRKAPIANLVIYGHAASNALFMREDRGFYASVAEVARDSHVVSGTEDERDEQLRTAGARDLSDLEWLVARGEIRFTRNPVIVFAGCGVAGKRDIDLAGIAARLAPLLNAKVIASIDVTDQSMGRGPDFRNKEYSRRTWVRFQGAQAPERLNTRVIDALLQLNFEGDVVAAAGPQATAAP